MNLFVYDFQLNPIGIVENYKSLIWSKRYNELGDCEVYTKATSAALTQLKTGYYLKRDDDDMICIIRKVELTTSADEGNYLIVTGVDARTILDQRIIWDTEICDGAVETFVRKLVTDSVGSGAGTYRPIYRDAKKTTILIQLGTAAGFTDEASEQVSYKNLGEKIREICQRYKWGYRLKLKDDGTCLLFELYAGTDRSSEVVFSDDYENLAASDYVNDETNIGNVALVAGDGEGADRRKIEVTTDSASPYIWRHEIYVDAKDISRVITWKELDTIYPSIDSGGDGEIVSVGGKILYRVDQLKIPIQSEEHLNFLHQQYPGGSEIGDDYRLYTQHLAELPSSDPSDSDSCTLYNVVYDQYLWARGLEKLAEYGAVRSFSGTVEPRTTFEYKVDYFLGDIVKVKNEFGISLDARITEVIEVEDDNGYSVEPKFEYISDEGE